MIKKLLNRQFSELTVKNKLSIFSLLLILGMIYYGNGLNNNYSLDDAFIFTNNPMANNGLSNIEDVFLKNSFQYGSYQFGYRPIAILSFAIESELFGINPKVSHLINFLLYILSCYLIFILTASLFHKESKIPLLIASLFLVMPIHTEIVNNVKCRDELLMFVFGLSAAIYWIKAKQQRWFGVLAVILVILSILSKKSGYIFLGVLPLLSFYTHNGSWKKLGLNTLLMTVPILCFRLLNKKLKVDKNDRDYSFAENPLFDPEIMEVDKYVMATESLWFYLKSLILPTKLVSYYGYQSIPFDSFSISGVLAVLLFLALLGFGALGFLKQKPYALAIAIMLGGILPFINLFKPMVGIVAERFLTVASFGFAAAIVLGLNEWLVNKKHQQYALILFMVYSICYLPFISQRNSEWESMYSLVAADAKKLPNSLILNYMKGNSILTTELKKPENSRKKKALVDEALAAYNKAYAVLPTKEVLNERATLYYKAYKQKEKAIKDYEEALKIDPGYEAVIKNLGKVYKEVGNRPKSISYFKQLIALNKRQDVYKELIRQLLESKRFEEAQHYNDTLKMTFPNQPDYLLNQANIQFIGGDLNGSLVYFKQYLQKSPNSPEVKKRIAMIERQLSKRAAE